MSANRRGLGRGLDALLGTASEPTDPNQQARKDGPTLQVEQLQPNPHQPRSEFDQGQLESLAASIKSRGLVQPIVVSDQGDGYTIVAGERRWRAAKLAGLQDVPVVFRDQVDERQMLELALIENLQRSDLNPIDEATAFAALRDGYQLSQERVARAVGKSRVTVANSLRLLDLPKQVQGWLKEGSLRAGQARPLLALGDTDTIVAVATKARQEGLSARQIEALVRAKSRKQKTPKQKEAHAKAAEDRLTRALQTKVEIQRRGKGGVIKVHFHSEDELIRLFDHLHRS